jgi:membrane-bound lytic murein transglycosylase B
MPVLPHAARPVPSLGQSQFRYLGEALVQTITSRLGRRLSAAVVIAAVPLSMASVHAIGSASSARVSSQVGPTLELAASSVAATLQPQPFAGQVTLAGRLALGTAAQRQVRISLSSIKGRHTWSASALAGHDLPSAAMRAYQHAAARTDAARPACHLPWTLLAGIGRVESDHGRYGGSVLGADGVPRPAIVGVALNGVGAVAAVVDSDRGRFDGDRVWDRAVGPMQFLPSTWHDAGMDGDGDGVSSPNDIDDASLAAAAYLCGSGRDLSRPADLRAAIFSYNPSDYYVARVSAFSDGYRTGTFVIPSPAVAAGAGDGVVHLSGPASASGATRAAARARAAYRQELRARAAHRRSVAQTRRTAAAQAHAGNAHPQPTPKPKPKPKPEPKPQPAPAQGPGSRPGLPPRPGSRPTPSPAPAPAPAALPGPRPTPSPTPVPATAHGPVLSVPGSWSVGGVQLTASDLSPLEGSDRDGDGVVEPASVELDGLVASAAPVTLTYLTQPSFVVVSLTLG